MAVCIPFPNLLLNFLSNQSPFSSQHLLFQPKVCAASHPRLLSFLHLTHSQTADPAHSALPLCFLSRPSLWPCLFPVSSVPLLLSQVPASIFFSQPMVTFFHLSASETYQLQALSWSDRVLTAFSAVQFYYLINLL